MERGKGKKVSYVLITVILNNLFPNHLSNASILKRGRVNFSGKYSCTTLEGLFCSLPAKILKAENRKQEHFSFKCFLTVSIKGSERQRRIIRDNISLIQLNARANEKPHYKSQVLWKGTERKSKFYVLHSIKKYEILSLNCTH